MDPLSAPCTSLLILATCVFSFLGFRSRAVEERYIFQPESILAGKEYFRLITSAFLHGGWQHLIFNMVSLYMFGSAVEAFFGKGDFLFIYFGAVVGGNLLSLYLHRNHEYSAYGASGGVCGIIFAHILLLPGSGVCLYFIPYSIPGWLYAIGFLAGSFCALKAARDNIGHDAHIGGAIVGLLIAAALHPDAVRYNWKVFGIVLGISAFLFVYFWRDPLFLPMAAFAGRQPWLGMSRSRSPRRKGEEATVDAVLDKVSKGGMECLTAKERALLETTARKYQEREKRERVESGAGK